MASAYGIVHQYGEPDSLFNPELAAGVLQHRQQKYDANIIKVEQTLQQLGLSTSMMLRPKDKEYMYEKVNGLIQSIPNLKDTDFSSNQATRSILTRVNEALDDHVIKHLGESKKFRDFQSQMQILQQENPEAYSEVNYQDAMMQSGFYDYMNPESGVDSMKSFNYTPYVDYQTEMLERIEQAKKVIGEQEVDFVDTDGVAKKRSISNMTISQWMNYMPNLVSADMEAQMRVEARAAYGWNDQAAQAEVQALKSSIEEDFDKRIARQKLAMSKTNNPKQRQLFKNEIAAYEDKKKEAIKGLNENVTAEQAGYQKIYQRMVRDNAALVGSDPSLTFLNSKQFADGKVPGSQQANLDAIGVQSISAAGASDYGDITAETFEEMESDARNSYNTWTNRGENFAKENKIDGFNYEEVLKTYKDEGFSEEDARFKTVQDAYKKSGKINEVKAGAQAQREYKNNLDRKELVHNKFIGKEYWEANYEKIYDAFTEKGAFDRQKIVVNGQEIPTADYLQQQNINSKEDFLKALRDDKLKPLIQATYADFALSETNTNATGMVTSLSEVVEKGKSFVSRISKTDLHNVNRLAISMGYEELRFTDIFNVTKMDTGAAGMLPGALPDVKEIKLDQNDVENLAKEIKFTGDLRVELREDAPEEIVSILKDRYKYNRREQGGNPFTGVAASALNKFATSVLGDSNIADDSSISNLFSYDSSSYKDSYTEALKTADITVNTPNKVSIKAETSKSKRTAAVDELMSVASSMTNTSKFNYKAELPAQVMVDPSNPNQVIIYQRDEKSKQDGEEIEYASADRLATVDLELFKQEAPTLSSYLDFSGTTGELNMNTRIDETAEGLDFMDDTDDRQVQGFYKATQNEALTRKASAGFAKELLNTQNRQLFDSQPMLRTVMTEAIDNPNRFRIRLQEDDEGVLGATVDINTAAPNAKQKEYEKLTTISFTPDEAEMAITSFDIAPQIFLTDALQKIAMLYQQQGSRSIDENPKTNLLLQSLFQN